MKKRHQLDFEQTEYIITSRSSQSIAKERQRVFIDLSLGALPDLAKPAVARLQSCHSASLRIAGIWSQIVSYIEVNNLWLNRCLEEGALYLAPRTATGGALSPQ